MHLAVDAPGQHRVLIGRQRLVTIGEHLGGEHRRTEWRAEIVTDRGDESGALGQQDRLVGSCDSQLLVRCPELDLALLEFDDERLVTEFVIEPVGERTIGRHEDRVRVRQGEDHQHHQDRGDVMVHDQQTHETEQRHRHDRGQVDAAIGSAGARDDRDVGDEREAEDRMNLEIVRSDEHREQPPADTADEHDHGEVSQRPTRLGEPVTEACCRSEQHDREGDANRDPDDRALGVAGTEQRSQEGDRDDADEEPSPDAGKQEAHAGDVHGQR